MLTPNMNQTVKQSSGKKLRDMFDELSEQDQQTVFEFTAFLHSKSEPVSKEIPAPKDIPRPEDESVIKATRRLSETYFMVDKGKMLNDTSTLMAQHVMQGRNAKDVIDDLESAFKKAYQNLIDASDQ